MAEVGQDVHIVGGSLHALYHGPKRLRDIGWLGQVGCLLDVGPGSWQLGRGPCEILGLHRLAQRDKACGGVEEGVHECRLLLEDIDASLSAAERRECSLNPPTITADRGLLRQREQRAL